MRRTVITVDYLQMLCLLEVLSSFFEELLKLLGYCFLRFVCWGACFLSSKSCLACCVICSLTSSKVYFDCGVAWLLGLLGLLRGDLLSLAFSVSINKLEVYK